MDDNFRAALAFTLRYEGGYSNNPKDPGGATMYGVTQRTYDAYRRRHARSHAEVRHITDSEVFAIYREGYWDETGCDQLALPLAMALLDTAVNYGPGAAEKMLRVPPDAAARQPWMEQKRAAVALCDARIAQRKRSRLFPFFGLGWLRRDHALKAAVLKMTEPTG